MSNSIGYNIFSPKTRIFLQVLTVLLFLGRAYQGIFWDLPIRALLWSQRLMEGPVHFFLGLEWHEYATHPNNDYTMSWLNRGTGFFWLLCALVAAFIHLKKAWMAWVLYLGSFSLFFLSILFSLDKFMLWGEFFEYTLQVGMPLWLVYVAFKGQYGQGFLWTVYIALAITFFAHGLYAYGIYPQPGPWVQWCMNMFLIPDDNSAKFFLKIMGVLDFIAAFFILLPIVWLRNAALWYCVIWGLMTALARLTSNFYWDFPIQSLHQWGHEVLYRLPHAGIPLLALWLKYQRTN